MFNSKIKWEDNLHVKFIHNILKIIILLYKTENGDLLETWFVLFYFILSFISQGRNIPLVKNKRYNAGDTEEIVKRKIKDIRNKYSLTIRKKLRCRIKNEDEKVINLS